MNDIEYKLYEIKHRQKERPVKNISYIIKDLIIEEMPPHDTHVLRTFLNPEKYNHTSLPPQSAFECMRTYQDIIPIHKIFYRDKFEDVYIKLAITKNIQEFLKLPFDIIVNDNKELRQNNEWLKPQVLNLSKTIDDLTRDNKFKSETIKLIENFTIFDRLKYLIFGKKFLMKKVYCFIMKHQIDFKDYYSLENFKLEREYETKTIVQRALLSYLKDIAKNDILKITDSKGHKTRFMSLIKSSINDILNPFIELDLPNYFLITILLGGKFFDKNNTIEYVYSKFIEFINQGNFQEFDFSTDKCEKCDLHLRYKFENWQMMILSNSSCLYEDKIFEVEVEFKSSEILVADWFRIEEFAEQVKYNKDYIEPSINSDYGLIKQTQYTADNFNFITIGVGNSCPYIFRKNDSLAIGHFAFDIDDYYDEVQELFVYDYLLDDYKVIDMVCTDLWAATIIDKQTLIDIVSNKTGLENAIQIVENYIVKEDIIKIDLPIGKYKARFNPRYMLNHFDKSFTENLEIIFTMDKV